MRHELATFQASVIRRALLVDDLVVVDDQLVVDPLRDGAVEVAGASQLEQFGVRVRLDAALGEEIGTLEDALMPLADSLANLRGDGVRDRALVVATRRCHYTTMCANTQNLNQGEPSK